jgi:UDP-N-acetylglucosamine acyltransferase
LKKIHATAVIDARAEIDEEVEIGPYVVLGAGVTLGPGTILQSHVVIEGLVTIGSRNSIGPGCVIGAPPQDLAFSAERKTSVVIGDDNIIREHCTIHRGSAEGSSTTVGNRNFFMVGAHLGHNCQVGNNVIIANNCLLAGHVRVDDQAFLGGGSTFQQNMRVGRLVMVQGSSAFGKDLPPFTMAAERNAVFGLNTIGMRRASFNKAQREDIKAAFKLLYLSGLNLSQALEQSATTDFGELGREFFEFVAEAKKRSVCPYRGKKDRDEAAGEV